MKNLLLLPFIIMATLSYAQINENEWSHKIFNSNVDKNLQLIKENTTPELLTIFKEIKALKFSEETNNSEGKFSVYNNPFSIEKENNSSSKNTEQLTALDVKIQEKLINNIVLKLLEKQNIINNESSFTYGDRIIKRYKQHIKAENKLNATLFKNKNIEVLIGKNIYNYIYKLHKTEFDLDLQSSLNLLVVNF